MREKKQKKKNKNEKEPRAKQTVDEKTAVRLFFYNMQKVERCREYMMVRYESIHY